MHELLSSKGQGPTDPSVPGLVPKLPCLGRCRPLPHWPLVAPGAGGGRRRRLHPRQDPHVRGWGVQAQHQDVGARRACGNPSVIIWRYLGNYFWLQLGCFCKLELHLDVLIFWYKSFRVTWPFLVLLHNSLKGLLPQWKKWTEVDKGKIL